MDPVTRLGRTRVTRPGRCPLQARVMLVCPLVSHPGAAWTRESPVKENEGAFVSVEQAQEPGPPLVVLLRDPVPPLSQPQSRGESSPGALSDGDAGGSHSA